MTEEKKKEFYTVAELAELLNVNPHTIYRLVKRGELPSHSIGRAIRFRMGDVEAFLAKHRMIPRPEGVGEA